MNFCSNCGQKHISIEIPQGDNRPRMCCKSCNMIFYQNPKIVCGALIVEKNGVMLCRRAIEPAKGRWNLPAGFMENNETVQQGAVREVKEEANASIEIVKLHAVFNVLHVNQVYMIFLAKMKDKEFGAGIETIETKFFEFDKIPWQEIAFQSNLFALKQYMKDPLFKGVHHGNSIDFIES